VPDITGNTVFAGALELAATTSPMLKLMLTEIISRPSQLEYVREVSSPIGWPVCPLPPEVTGPTAALVA